MDVLVAEAGRLALWWWVTLELTKWLGLCAGVVDVYVGKRPDLGVYMMATYAVSSIHGDM